MKLCFWRKPKPEPKPPLPVLYNEYDVTGIVPLSYLKVRTVRLYKPACQKNVVEVGAEIYNDPNEVDCLTVVLETNKGVWCRTIESPKERDWEIINIDENDLSVKVGWQPIYAGQDLIVHDAYVVHGGRVLKPLPFRDMTMNAGDCLNVTYSLVEGVQK